MCHAAPEASTAETNSVPQQPREPQSATPEPTQSGQGLLEFFGKVLDQLSLSAWLPATMLVGVGALLAQVSTQQEFDFAEAISDLTELPLGVLLFIAFALILATMTIQAFQFEAIRTLEGYWGTSKLASLLSDVRIEAHARRQERLVDREKKARRVTFTRAREEMLDRGVERALIDILESDFWKTGTSSDVPDEKLEEARSMGWHIFAPPSTLRQVDSIRTKLKMYPERHRILPTLLGNALRSFEDQLVIADGGDVQGFILRNYDKVSPTLLVRQAQFRTRLDMYCTLVLVYGLLGFVSLPALWHFVHWHLASLAAFTLFAALAAVSYAAAISSARGYGIVLVAIDAQVTAALQQADSGVIASSESSSENA